MISSKEAEFLVAVGARQVLVSIVLLHTLFGAIGLVCISVSEAEPCASNVFAAIILHYDTYYPSINLAEAHSTFEAALSQLRDEGFPMGKVMVVTWRNTFDNKEEFAWLMNALAKYDVSVDMRQFGLYLAPEDSHDSDVLSYALDTFKQEMEAYPLFVAGFSAGSDTYSGLIKRGVELSFLNLWEEGEDYSFRGYSTGDELFGANWEGAPFQPYKPSKRTVNAPGTTMEDELDIWEAHWITRNPSYAFMVVNSRNWGSLHPSDLLQEGLLGTEVCQPSEALEKLRVMLDLIDLNAGFNPLMVVSYPVEVSLLSRSEVFEMWRASVRELIRREYRFVDAGELRGILDSLNAGAPHTPVYVWFDNLTSSDLVVAEEHTPFAMVSSPYGRFIYGRRDASNDSGTPFISLTSYTTSRAYNRSFQSIRELSGVGKLKMNTIIEDVPLDMRWLNDISTITIVPSKAIMIRWVYNKGEAPYVRYSVTTYLTLHGVLVRKEMTFTERVSSPVFMIHHFTVKSNSPTPILDGDAMAETDAGNLFRFSSANAATIAKRCQLNNTIMFTATDGYRIAVTITSGKPDMVRVFDEPYGAPFQTLEFTHQERIYEAGDELRLSYALTPATDTENARKLADYIKTLTEDIESGKIQGYKVMSKGHLTRKSPYKFGIAVLTLTTLLVTSLAIAVLKSR